MHKETVGFPGGSLVNNLPASIGDVGLIPELGLPWSMKLQLTSLFLPEKSPMNREACLATYHSVAKCQT